MTPSEAEPGRSALLVALAGAVAAGRGASYSSLSPEPSPPSLEGESVAGIR